MPGSRRVVALLDANARVGFGHLQRVLNVIAAMAPLEPGLTATLVGDLDLSAIRRIRDRGHLAAAPGAGGAADLRGATVLVDRYDCDDDALARLAGVSGPVVLIDDAGQRRAAAAQLVVNFCIDAPSFAYLAPRQLLGCRYFIGDPRLDDVRRSGPPGDLPGTVLVMIGSHDPHSVTDTVVEHAWRGLEPAVIHVVGAPPSDSLRRRLGARLTHEDHTDDVPGAMARADLVISSGGMAKYEAAFCRRPVVCVSNTALEARESDSVMRAGLCDHVGPAWSLDADAVTAALSRERVRATASRVRSASREHFRAGSTAAVAQAILEV